MREIMDHIQAKTIEDYSKLYTARYQAIRVTEDFKVDNLTEGQKEDFDRYKELLYQDFKYLARLERQRQKGQPGAYGFGLYQDFKYLARFEDYNSLMNVLSDIENNLTRCEVILESADWHI